MEENQTFHPFFTLLAVFVAVYVNFLVVYQTEMNMWLSLSIMLFNSGLALTFLFAKMKTVYSKEGIYIRFFPFIWKEKNLLWTDIKLAKIRQYSPIKEYGGWGIRFSRKNGRAYNVRGKMGLQIVFKSDKMLLIGTQQPTELENYLSTIETLKVNDA